MLAIIVSTQVFTMACDARCSKMALTDPAIAVQNYQGSLHPNAFSDHADLLPPAISRCKDLLCKNDSASLTLPFAVSLSGSAILQEISHAHRLASEPFVEPVHIRSRRSTAQISAFDPVLSSLRI